MSKPKNRRSSRRLPPRGKGKATCRKGALDLGVNLAVGVLDLSETGARLLLKEGLPVGQEVSITLETPASGLRLLRLANIIWSIRTADGAIAVGVRFQKHVRFAELDHLART